MRRIAAAWVITCVAATASATDIHKAPKLPSWPDGLPDPVELEDGSHLLPPTLAAVVHERLLLLDRYPVRCQARLDGLRRVANAERDKSVIDCEANARRRLIAAIEDAQGWSTWQTVVVALVAGVVGAAAGATFVALGG